MNLRALGLKGLQQAMNGFGHMQNTAILIESYKR